MSPLLKLRLAQITLIALFLGLGLVGLVRRWRQADEPACLWIVLLGAHIGSFILLPLARFLATGARLVVPDNAANEVLVATFQVGLTEGK